MTRKTLLNLAREANQGNAHPLKALAQYLVQRSGDTQRSLFAALGINADTIYEAWQREIKAGKRGAVLNNLLTTLLATGMTVKILTDSFKIAVPGADPLRVLAEAQVVQVEGLEPDLRRLLRVLLGVVADGDRTQLIDALARQCKCECKTGKRGSVLTALELALLATGMTVKILTDSFKKAVPGADPLRVLAEAQVVQVEGLDADLHALLT